MKYEILFSSRFKKSFARLEVLEKKAFYRELSLFIETQKHPSLRTKKIKGSEILFESSINMSIRIIWAYQDGNLVIMLDIGHHDMLKRM